MLYFVILTRICNLRCKYCGNNPDPSIEPIDITYTIDDLKFFIEKDPEPVIAFYGGEPLLRIKLMEEIMDKIRAKRYILQTNGLLLHKLNPKYLKKFDTILVSIDGRQEVTDYYRGRGVYQRILRNIKYIRDKGFRGDLIARMAVSGKTDIYEDVKHLIELRDPGFDHVHWQLDVLWDSPPYQRYENFDEWLEEYNRGITRLIEYWINEMKVKRKVPGIVPFLGIMKSLLFNEKVKLRCGAGIDAFAITTSGRILACPIAPEFEWNILGDIYNSSPMELPGKIEIEEPCKSCEICHICGGRCLFANKTKLWGEEGFKKVCKTVKHLVNELLKVKPEIEQMIRNGVIRIEDFNYPKYNNTTEIIP